MSVEKGDTLGIIFKPQKKTDGVPATEPRENEQTKNQKSVYVMS